MPLLESVPKMPTYLVRSPTNALSPPKHISALHKVSLEAHPALLKVLIYLSTTYKQYLIFIVISCRIDRIYKQSKRKKASTNQHSVNFSAQDYAKVLKVIGPSTWGRQV